MAAIMHVHVCVCVGSLWESADECIVLPCQLKPCPVGTHIVLSALLYTQRNVQVYIMYAGWVSGRPFTIQGWAPLFVAGVMDRPLHGQVFSTRVL